MSDTLMQAGMLVGMVLGGAGFGLGVYAAIKVTLLADRVEDALTPSFTTELREQAAIDEFAKADTDPGIEPLVATARRTGSTTTEIAAVRDVPPPKPSPAPRTDTNTKGAVIDAYTAQQAERYGRHAVVEVQGVADP